MLPGLFLCLVPLWPVTIDRPASIPSRTARPPRRVPWPHLQHCRVDGDRARVAWAGYRCCGLCGRRSAGGRCRL